MRNTQLHNSDLRTMRVGRITCHRGGYRADIRVSPRRREMYTMSQKTSHLGLLWFWHLWTDFDIFGRNVTDRPKVSNQKTL